MAFLTRLASHFNRVLVPEATKEVAHIFFGFPVKTSECILSEYTYTSGISEKFYDMGREQIDLGRCEFQYYDVISTENLELGM